MAVVVEVKCSRTPADTQPEVIGVIVLEDSPCCGGVGGMQSETAAVRGLGEQAVVGRRVKVVLLVRQPAADRGRGGFGGSGALFGGSSHAGPSTSLDMHMMVREIQETTNELHCGACARAGGGRR